MFGGFGFFELIGNRLDTIRVNDGYHDILRAKRLRAQTDNFFKLVQKSDLPRFQAAVNRTVATSLAQKITFAALAEDSTIYLKAIIRRIGGADKRPLLCIAFSDVTQEIENEQQLRQSNSFLSGLYDALPCAVVEFRQNARGTFDVHSINDATWRLLGYKSRSDLFDAYDGGKNVHFSCLSRDTEKQAFELIKTTCLTRQPKALEHFLQTTDGTNLWCRSELRPITLASGSVAVQCTIFDITAQKNAVYLTTLNKIAAALFIEYDKVFEVDLKANTISARSKDSLDDSRRVFAADKEIPTRLKEISLPAYHAALNQMFLDAKQSKTDTFIKNLEFETTNIEAKWRLLTLVKVAPDTFFLCSKNISEQKQLEAEAAQTKQLSADSERAKRLALLIDCAKMLSTSDSDNRDVINLALEYTRNFFDADRAYIIEETSERGMAEMLFEQVKDGAEAQMQLFQKTDTRELPVWNNIFHGENYVFIPSVKALPKERKFEKDFLEKYNVESLLATSIVFDGKPLGFIALDDPKRNTSDVAFLSAIGYLISLVLSKRYLQKQADNVELLLETLVGSAHRGAGLYYLDGDKLHCSWVSRLGISAMGYTPEEYQAEFYDNALLTAHENDRELLLSTIKETVKAKDTTSLVYRIRTRDGAVVPIQATISYVKTDTDGAPIVYALFVASKA